MAAARYLHRGFDLKVVSIETVELVHKYIHRLCMKHVLSVITNMATQRIFEDMFDKFNIIGNCSRVDYVDKWVGKVYMM